jgi:NAD(P)-dependent dehydrogenase (short-subunit alcohol dehydrogenase family)
MQTILITGCSSGFGLDTARTFLERGWRVIATMRTPRADLLPASAHVQVLPLDVTDAASIEALVARAGPVDALVNNAGVGLLGVFEGTPMAAVRGTFETNLFGAMAVTQAFLPQLRERRDGVVVNVSSSTTLLPLPMVAAYTASKAALNAFTESLALELEPFGVRVRLVLPGSAPDTAFGQNAQAAMRAQGVGVPEPYAEFAQAVFARMAARRGGPHTRAEDVAEAVWRAVTDPAAPLRQPAGADAVALAGAP